MEDLVGCGGSVGRSSQKIQVSIKSQTGVIAKKHKKRAWEEELGDEGVLSEVQEKTQLSMKSQTGDMAKKTKKGG